MNENVEKCTHYQVKYSWQEWFFFKFEDLVALDL